MLNSRLNKKEFLATAKPGDVVVRVDLKGNVVNNLSGNPSYYVIEPQKDGAFFYLVSARYYDKYGMPLPGHKDMRFYNGCCGLGVYGMSVILTGENINTP